MGAAPGSPGGAPLTWVWVVRGRALSHPRPPVLWGVWPGPTTHWLWVRGVRAWGPVTNPTARALASWLCALGGRREGARGGRLLPGCGASGVGRSPTPDRPSFGACGRGPLPTGCGCGRCGRGDPSPTPQRALLRAGFARCGGGRRAPGGGASCLGVGRQGSGALPPPTARPLGRVAGAHYPLAVGAGGAGVGTRHQPHSARSCELALRAVGAAAGRPGGAPLALVWGVRGRALSHPRPPVLWGVRPGPTTHWLWMRGVRAWGPVTNPTARALASWLCALGGRREAVRGGRLLPRCGASGVGRSRNPVRRSFGACGRGPLPTGCGCGGCGCGGPAVLGTSSHAAVRRVLCALPGFAAPGGRCGLAPVLVPWLWRAACLSGVPRGPALMRRASSGPVALRAPVGFPVAVVPSPTPGAVAPGFTGWLPGARGGRPRTGLIVPAAGPCRGRGAGRAPGRTRLGPRDGVSLADPSGFGLRLRALRWFGVCGPGH